MHRVCLLSGKTPIIAPVEETEGVVAEQFLHAASEQDHVRTSLKSLQPPLDIRRRLRGNDEACAVRARFADG